MSRYLDQATWRRGVDRTATWRRCSTRGAATDCRCAAATPSSSAASSRLRPRRTTTVGGGSARRSVTSGTRCTPPDATPPPSWLTGCVHWPLDGPATATTRRANCATSVRSPGAILGQHTWGLAPPLQSLPSPLLFPFLSLPFSPSPYSPLHFSPSFPLKVCPLNTAMGV